MLLDVHTDWPQERFQCGRLVELVWDDGRRQERRIRSYRRLAERSLLAFEDVEDIGAAQELAGAWVLAERAALPPIGDEVLHHADLVGLEVVSREGVLLGWGVGVLEAPQGDLLRVRRPDGSEVLAPLAPAICVAVDLTERRIVLDPPVGLFDLERAETVEPRPTSDRPREDE